MTRKHRNAPSIVATTGARAATWQVFAVAAGLIAITLAVYAPVRHFDFVQVDDPVQVVENPQVAAGLSPASVAWAFTSARAGYWMPLVWLSHMLDVQLYGMQAGPHHVTNLVLHLACTLLLFGLLVRMTGRPWPSAFVAALFAVHPLHVESVAWITERKDVLSTLFWMLTLWAYVWWVRRGGRARYAVVLVLFALGLMAKSMLVTLPVVMLLLDYWPLERLKAQGSGLEPAQGSGLRALVIEKMPFFALAAAAAVVVFLTQRQAGAMSDLQVYPLGLRVGNALLSYVAYIGKMFWPADLVVLYSFPSSIDVGALAGAIVLLAGVSVVVLRSARRRPYLAVGWFWYVITLLPVIGLVQVGLQGMADRFTYVPLIGLFVMLAWGVPDLLAVRSTARRAVVGVAAALVVIACAWTARAQVGYWKDNVALWTHTTQVALHLTPYQAHMSLGAALRDQGRLDEAAAHFRLAVQIDAQPPEAHEGLATVLASQGKMSEALAQYEEAVRLAPSVAEGHNNLGTLLAQQGRFDEAIPHFAEAARLKPALEIAHLNLALAFVKTGRNEEAFREFNEVLRLNPANQVARRAIDSARRSGER